MLIKLKVKPGASEDRVVRVCPELIELKVTAPPVKGKANRAVIKLLSEFLGISRSQIQIIKGEKSRAKVVAIEGITGQQLKSLLIP